MVVAEVGEKEEEEGRREVEKRGWRFRPGTRQFGRLGQGLATCVSVLVVPNHLPVRLDPLNRREVYVSLT